MTKRLILTSALCLFTMLQTTFAQFQLENAGFEEWENGSTSKPVAWNTYETAQGSLAGTASNKNQCKKSTDVRPGSKGAFSVSAISRSILGISANGIITSGVINADAFSADSPKNNNQTVVDNPNKSMKFTGRPDSVVAWIKAKPLDSKQTGRFYIILHDNSNFQDPVNSNSDWDKVSAVAGVNPPAYSDWVRYACPFYYYGETHEIAGGNRSPGLKLTGNERPYYVLATISTNYLAGEGTAGDELYCDDIEMIYNSKLKSLTFNSVSVPGFKKDIYSYEVESSYSESALKCESDGRYATIEKSYNEATKVLTITVKGDNYEADNSNKHVYTIAFGCRARLKGFAVDGTQLSDFSSDKLEYTIDKKYEEVKSTISYSVPACAKATEVWDASADMLTITVDGDDQKVYKFKFRKAYGSVLTDLKLGGETIPGFSSSNSEYSSSKIYSKDLITYTASEGATVESVFDESTNQLTITVKGADVADYPDNVHTYKVQFYGSLLKSLEIAGKAVEGFSPNTFNYTVSYVYDNAKPKFVCDPKATYDLSFDDKTYLLTLTVKGGDFAQNSSNKHTYTIQYHAPYESVLTDLQIAGTTLTGFSSTEYDYTTTRSYSEGLVTYKASADAIVETTFAANKLTITVKGGDFADNQKNKHVYTIQFHAPYGSQLKSLKIAGKTVSGFASNVYSYTVSNSYKAEQLEFTVEEKATYTTSYNESTHVMTIVVKGGDIAENPTNTHTYTIQYHAAYGSQLKSLTIAGKTVDGFSSNIYSYTVANTYNESDLKFTVDDEATTKISFNQLNYLLTIVVNGGDISTNPSNTHTYTIQYHAPYGSYLKSITIAGKSLNSFSPTTTSYKVDNTYNPEELSLNVDAEATYDLQFDETTQILTIVVKGGDYAFNPTNTHTYTIEFHAPYGSQIKSLSIAGKAVEGFSPNVYEYSVDNNYNRSELDYTLDAEAIADVSYNSSNYLLTITVKGGDYAQNATNVHTYKIWYHAPYESILTDLKVNGVAVPNFSSSSYKYTLSDVYVKGQTTINYTASLKTRVEEHLDESTNTYTIVVKGGNVDKNPDNVHTYTIGFHAAYGSQLKSLTVNEKAISDFDKNKYTYKVNEYYKGKVAFVADEESKASYSFDESTNVLSIVVNGGDIDKNPTNTHTYSVQFCSKAFLSSLKYNGTTVPAFQMDKYNYDLSNLNYDASKVEYDVFDDATAELKFDSESSRLVITISGSDLNLYPDNIHTYTIQFKAPLGSYMTSFAIAGKEFSGFSKTQYEYVIPQTYKSCRDVLEFTYDLSASSVRQFDESTNTLVINVKSGDNLSSHTYKFRFYAPCQLTNLRVNAKPVSGFSSDKYFYSLTTMNYETANVTCVEDEGATVEKSYSSDTYQFTIVVKGRDIALFPENYKTYTIQFGKPLESKLVDLKVNGATIEGFDKNVFQYVTDAFYDENSIAFIADSAAEVSTSFDNKNFVLTLRVESGDIATNPANYHVYTIAFADPTYYGSQLQELAINGVPFADFSKEQYEYQLEGSLSDMKIKYVADDLSSVTEVYDEESNSLIVTIKGGNIHKDESNYHTYVFRFTSKFVYEAYITSFSINGVNLDSFDKNKYTHVIEGDYASSMVKLEVSQLANYCTEYDKATGILTVVVWAGNFEKNNKNFTTYKVTFKK